MEEFGYVIIAISSAILCTAYLCMVFSDVSIVGSFEEKVCSIFEKIFVRKTIVMCILATAVRSVLRDSLDEKNLSLSIICVILLITNLIFKFSPRTFTREYEATYLIINSTLPVIAFMKVFSVEGEFVSVGKVMWIVFLGALIIGDLVFVLFNFISVREWTIAFMKVFSVEGEFVSVGKVMWIVFLGALIIGDLVFVLFNFISVREWTKEWVGTIAAFCVFAIRVYLFLDICYSIFYFVVKTWMPQLLGKI